MKVVIGLGNPGSQYERTRHNVGWLVLDRLAERAGLAGRHKAKDAAVTVRGRHRGIDLVLVKPTTYMNLSGVAVRKVLARERVPLSDMLIVVDDFDLPFGRLRMRAEGSAGTHNGLRSIVAEMGTQKWARLRVGIGVGTEGHGGSAKEHVLTTFTTEEMRALPEVLDAAADAVEVWATDGPARAADRFNAGGCPIPRPGAWRCCRGRRRWRTTGPPPMPTDRAHPHRLAATAATRARRRWLVTDAAARSGTSGRDRRIDAQVAERVAARGGTPSTGSRAAAHVIACRTSRRSHASRRDRPGPRAGCPLGSTDGLTRATARRHVV